MTDDGEPLHIIPISVNCGNDASGIEQNIKQILEFSQPDMVTIHAQEVYFSRELANLSSALEGTPYAIAKLEERVTITKMSSDVLGRNTGMCNFIIYDTRKFNPPVQDTRETVNLAALKLSNKGAVINTVTIPLKDSEESLRIKLIAGHLDSNHSDKRLREWQGIHQTLYPRALDWDGLVSTIPDCTFGGFDMNTRFKVDNLDNPYVGSGTVETKTYIGTTPIGVVFAPDSPTYDKPSLKAMKKGLRYSETYSSSDSSSEESLSRPPSPSSVTQMPEESSKRPGEVDMGILDVVFSMTGQEKVVAPSTTCEIIPFDLTTKRDHCAVIGPTMSFLPYIDSFAKVKAHVLNYLKLYDQGAKLTGEQSMFEELNRLLSTEQNPQVQKALLLQYYNDYVSLTPRLNLSQQLTDRTPPKMSFFSAPKPSDWSSDEEEVLNPLHKGSGKR